MRKILLLTFVISTSNLFAQTEFDISFNQGYGERPTYTEFSESETISENKAKELYTFLKDSTNLEFRYSYGSCEDRAHVMSLILKNKGIVTKKIWNFDPYYISLFHSQQQLSSTDHSKLQEKVYWGFHVAPVIQVRKGTSIKLVIIDPSLANNILYVDDWLKLQNAPNSYYTYTDNEWVSFATINGLNYNNNPIPIDFPSLLTGDFYKNEGQNFIEQWIEEGVSVNKIAMIIKKQIIDNPTTSDLKKTKYKNLLINIEKLTDALKNPDENPFQTKIEKDEFSFYQQLFNQQKKEWKIKLDTLR